MPAAPRPSKSAATKIRTSSSRAPPSKACTKPTPISPTASTKAWTISATRSSSISALAIPAGSRSKAPEPNYDAAKQFAAATKVATVTVTDAGGTQTIEVRRDKDKNVFVKSSAVEGLYKANADLADGVDKGVDDFRNKKLFDFGFSDPSRVEVKGTGYTKAGDKWTANGKTMDNASVQTLIDKLRDLAATKFAEKGGGEPIFDATVISNSGKRTEKVAISKQGTQYFAQRDGEPSIYELDSKVVEDLRKAASEVKEAPPESPKKK